MRLALLLACLACVPLGAAADEVRLANGDRISGEVKGKAGGKLVVLTSPAGEVALETAQVVSVTVVGPDGTAREVALADIAAVDAPPADGGAAYAGHATVSAAYTSGNVESERLYADAELTARAGLPLVALGQDRAARGPRARGQYRVARRRQLRPFLGRAALRLRAHLGRARRVQGHRPAHGARRGLRRAALRDAAGPALGARGPRLRDGGARIAGPNEGYPAAGWGVKASSRPRGPKLELFHEQDGFWNLEDTDAVVLRSKTGLRMPLIARINASAQLNLDWERRPAPGRASTDRTLLLGLDYTW